MYFKNRTSIALILLLLPLVSIAQTGYKWMITGGGPSYSEFAIDVDVDDWGNVYMVGEYFDGALLGDSIYNTQGDNDMFLAKYDPYGRVKWVQTFGSPQLDRSYAVNVGGDGTVFITGYGKVIFPSLVAMHARDALIARFDTSGNLIWGRNLDGDVLSEGTDIVGNTAGGCYQVGMMETKTYIDNDTLYGNGGRDGMLFKFGPNGEHRWSMTLGGSGEDYISGIGMDRNENVVVGGFFENSMTLGTTTLNSVGGKDAFLAKVDSAGNHVWALSFSGLGNNKVTTVRAAPDGNVYFAGHFENDISVGSFNFSTNAFHDIFYGKCSASGSVVWAKEAGGSSLDFLEDLEIDEWENIYLTGFYFGSFQIGNQSTNSAGSDDAFLAKLDSAGNLLLFESPHYSSTRDMFGIAVDKQQNILVSGSFLTLIDLLGDTIYSNNNSTDIFLAKYASLAPSIILDSVTGLGECVDSTFELHYSLQGYFDSSNVFTVDLSNVNGGFGGASPVGQVQTGICGVVPLTVPLSAPNGSLYRVRMRSSFPVLFSPDNGVDLTIAAQLSPPLVLSGDTIVCGGDTAALNIPNGYASQIWSTGSTDTSETFTNPGDYWVMAIDGNGCEQYFPFSVVQCVPNELERPVAVQLYPNPSTGRFRLEVQAEYAANWELRVHDLAGRELIQEGLSGQAASWSRGLDLSVFPEGMYFLKLSSDEYSLTYKLWLAR